MIVTLFVLAVPLGMETLGVLCGQVDQVSEPDWEIYQSSAMMKAASRRPPGQQSSTRSPA